MPSSRVEGRHRASAARFRWRVLLASALVFLVCSLGLAEDVDVPVDLQVALISRVAAYDRNLPQRAKGAVSVWVLMLRGNADSEQVAQQMAAAFGKVPAIGGMTVHVEMVDYTQPAKLLERCRRQPPTILVLTPGMSSKLSQIEAALRSQPILTVAAIARYVDEGAAVLAVESRSGKPSLVVHLPQARLHQVAFKPELLKLARVIR